MQSMKSALAAGLHSYIKPHIKANSSIHVGLENDWVFLTFAYVNAAAEQGQCCADGSPTAGSDEAEQQGGIKSQKPRTKLIQDKFTSLMAPYLFQPNPSLSITKIKQTMNIYCINPYHFTLIWR